MLGEYSHCLIDTVALVTTSLLPFIGTEQWGQQEYLYAGIISETAQNGKVGKDCLRLARYCCPVNTK